MDTPEYQPKPLSPQEKEQPAVRFFGEALLSVRRSMYGHRIDDFAATLGTTGFNIAQIESSRVAVPTLSVIAQWSKRLHLSNDDAMKLQANAKMSGFEAPEIRKIIDATIYLMRGR